MIREFDAESGSHQTASSANQSAIFTFSAENSRIARTLAHFPDLRAPEKIKSGNRQLIYARFSLLRIEPVPFAPIFLPRKALARPSTATNSADPRALEKLTFGPQSLIYARFSLSRNELVPFVRFGSAKILS
jgi:hypothetical protein